MSFEVSRFDEHRQGNESIGGKMMNSNDTLIPLIGVVTDIRQDTPDVKTFRVVSPDGGKVFQAL